MSIRVCLAIAALASACLAQTGPASAKRPDGGRSLPAAPGTAGGPVCRSVPTQEGAGQTGRCVIKESDGPKHSYSTQGDEETDLLYLWFGIHGDEECVPPWVLAEIPEGYELSEECQICEEKQSGGLAAGKPGS